ncbi:glucosidase [uncultured Enterovirga sp.]|uniref:MGH1-like glycoside hydrolase domain-containing protein n=1 Tax=uncultured Enterovirga sp. TaxID=2026352 RepID=UPI0035CC4939
MPQSEYSPLDPERERLAEQDAGREPWRLWGPYLSERQWGTVREDYSAGGDAWSYLPHDHARSRVYRWGEDGIAGISDDRQLLCFALALWNGRDPILKERLFGLTNQEGNHGEDVKELSWHLDATPTHSYLKHLYKHPQAAFPYAALVAENARRGRDDPEYELLDTGIFDENRYFDVTVEYAKEGPDDIHVLITVSNRGPDAAGIHVLPQLWFRNCWSWRPGMIARRPHLAPAPDGRAIRADHPWLDPYHLAVEGNPELLFCENETNARRHFGMADAKGPFKDGFHAAIVDGDRSAVASSGTKSCVHHRLVVPAGGEVTIRLRLSAGEAEKPVDSADAIIRQRRAEADAFYAVVQAGIANPDARAVQRQAFAGMIWSKQFYRIDVRRWLDGDPLQPAPPPERLRGRGSNWRHLNAADILSMPDSWEYPWFAAWDLAFHCLPLALIDPAFAKDQLVVLTREWYMHPNGQLPAYEWEFGDVNPPVHAWATWRVFEIDRERRGDRGDIAFLERVFHKLMINFTWWVNRKDAGGRNVFQGGFLGLDNVGVFDRSNPPPAAGRVNQADGTAWMAMYALNLMRIALELATHNPVYEDVATKFFEHFLLVAEAMTAMGEDGLGLWDEEDQFFYDELDLPDGRKLPLRLRSIVGLVPLFAVEVIEPATLQRLPDFARRMDWVLKNRPELAALVSRWQQPGLGDRKLLSLLRGHRMKALLRRMLDETEFLSPHGIRSMSRIYRDQPYHLPDLGTPLTVRYVPGDSDSGLFGGNSNWRGPVWFPLNFLLIESLRRFHSYYGDEFRIECPTGSGTYLTIDAVADELARRLTGLFLRDGAGSRPVYGDRAKLQHDPHFRDLVHFHEFFHGDTGLGLGASHQTGWTGLVANLLQPRP